MTEPTLTAKEHPDSPSLSDWHALFTTVRERLPDAPGLTDEFSFDLDDGVLREDLGLGAEYYHSGYTALCVMLDWAMRFGAWWVLSDPKCEIDISPIDHVWSVDVYNRRNIEDTGRLLSGILLSANFKSHHAAYFAAVQAIGESNEKAKSNHTL
jgi:hypothetical protein